MPPPNDPKPGTSATARKAVLEDTLILNTVKSYFKYASVLLSVWGVGYFAFSPSWLLLGLVVFVWKEKHKTSQKLQIDIAQEASRDEKQAILARVEDLPSWVFFPDVERAEWVNKMIAQMWPFIGDYVKDLLHKSIEPSVKKSLPAAIAASFRFSHIDLGDIPPRIGGVKVYTENVRRDEIYMDLEIIYSSDSEITVAAKGINAGIKDLQIHGTMRVIFKPLISKIPLFGGMSVFFINNPTVDFNLTSLANAFDLPGLSDMLKSIVEEQIANIMVLPNRISISMAKGLDLNKLRYPQPQGVLRIHIIEAKDLKKADISITGKGKSDPYVILAVGAQQFTTKVIDNTVEPVWDEFYEAIVDVADGQLLTMEVNDKDPGNKDDSLGNLSIDIRQVHEEGVMDEWLPLEDVKKGLVHINLTWLHLANDPLELDRMESENKTDEKFSSCILLVNLDSARDLPRGKKSLNEPSPHVFLSVGTVTKESWVKVNTVEPRWEQNFRFLVHNPNYQNLDIDVKDKNTGKSLGICTLKMRELLGAMDMVIDQKFPLKNCTTNAFVNMRVSLRVLTTTSNPEWNRETDLMKEEEEEETPVQSNSPGTSVDEDVAVTAGKTKAAVPEGGATSSTSPDEMIRSKDVRPEESSVRQRNVPSVSDAGKGAYGLGRIQLTLQYMALKNKLIIVVHKCSNLMALDSNNLSDPYVRIYLTPEKAKRKTDVIKDNLNPVFDESFDFPVSPSEVPSKMIDLAVKNEVNMFSSNKHMMGATLIDLGNMNLNKAVTQWFDLQPEDSVERVTLETQI